MTNRLVIRQPFDLALTLEMGQTFRWRRRGDEAVRHRDWGDPPEHWRTGGGWYSGVLGPYLVHIRQTSDGVEYRVGGSDGELTDIDLSRTLHDYFRLGDDIEAIYAQLRRDPIVAQAIDTYPGLRLLRQEPWECLVSFVCTRSRRIRDTRRDIENIARLSHHAVTLDDDADHVFPTVQTVACRERELMRLPLGLANDTIPALVRWLAAEPSGLAQLADPSVSASDAVRRLEERRGVGPKIASCVALMSLDKLDAFPVDRWVQRALARCDLSAMPPSRRGLGLEERVKSLRPLTGAQQYRVSAWARECFGRYSGYAGQYLFHWVEPHKDLVRRAGACPVCGTDWAMPPEPTT